MHEFVIYVRERNVFMNISVVEQASVFTVYKYQVPGMLLICLVCLAPEINKCFPRIQLRWMRLVTCTCARQESDTTAAIKYHVLCLQILKARPIREQQLVRCEIERRSGNVETITARFAWKLPLLREARSSVPDKKTNPPSARIGAVHHT
jgi:hypothetical protein